MSTTEASTNANSAQAAQSKKRKHLLLIIAIVLVLGAIAYGLYWLLVLSHVESTDDAYVNGNIVQITPQISGTVIAIHANDTDTVAAGDTLVKLDPTDQDVALASAESALAQTVREVRNLYANNATLAANVRQREEEAKRGADDRRKALEDFQRRAALASTGAVSKEELQHAQSALDNASNALSAAKAVALAAAEQLNANLTLTDGMAIQQHPNVQQAASRVRSAYLNRARCDIAAPVTGLVGKRSVQIGQRIQPGGQLMVVVPLEQVWVDANFKESQLRQMRIGQPVSLHADIYSSKIDYKGHVIGFSAGTGAAFSLLPAQNATGNWIKIVQRLPVRIALDADTLKEHPLRIGLSMQVEVDTSDHSGKLMADSQANSISNTTDVFGNSQAAVDALIQKIITDNLGKAVKPIRSGELTLPLSNDYGVSNRSPFMRILG